MERPKVLLLAEQANPNYVSVPLIGWLLAVHLREVADVHLVTQISNRDAIMLKGWAEGKDFTAVDSDALAKPIHDFSRWLQGDSEKGWTVRAALSLPSYYYFEHLVWKIFGPRILAGEFDVVHRITPLSPAVPSTIAGRCKRAGVPFVIGPLNGGLPWPKGFEKIREQEGDSLSRVRNAYKLFPGQGNTKRNAAAIIVASRQIRDEFDQPNTDKCVYIPENGIDPEHFKAIERPAATAPLRAAYLGRLVPLKGVDMLIDAAAPLVQQGNLLLDIIGGGPEKARLEALVRSHNIQDQVSFAGRIEHAKVQERLAQSDLFVFPSIRDFGGGAVLEAMAMGLAPVVLDYGGPAEIVSLSTGFAVPLRDRQQVVTGLRDALSQLVANPATVRPLGELARERALQLYSWQQKSMQILQVYEWVLGRTAKKPCFRFLGDEQTDPRPM